MAKAKPAAAKVPETPVAKAKRTKLKVTQVQTETARICDCDHVEINVAEASRVIHAHFIALGHMQLRGEVNQFQILEYLNDQLEKGLADAKSYHNFYKKGLEPKVCDRTE